MEQCCGNCINLNTHDKREAGNYFSGYYDTFYCREFGKYFATDEGRNCRYWRECPYNQNNNSGGCFITTTVNNVKILSLSTKLDDKCKLLNTLRHFREIMKKDETHKYDDVLKQYDVVGPIIANHIENETDDNKRTLICLDLLSNYLYPTAENIERHNYEEAVRIYTQMVIKLQNVYGISINLRDYEYVDSKDPKIGHGTARVHKK